MAVIGESGIKRDSDSSTPLERHSQPNSNFSHSNGSPRGLSNGSDLRKSQSVAKPRETSSGSNPLQKVAQTRCLSTDEDLILLLCSLADSQGILQKISLDL